MNIAIFYFSATGISETISNHIAVILQRKTDKIITSFLISIITPYYGKNLTGEDILL
jgi:flavodoxin